MAGKWAKGTIFSVMVGAVDTPIASLTNIGGLDLSAEEIDISAHDSEDDYKEFIQGFKDGGSVSLEGNFTNVASQVALKTLFDAGTVTEMSITFPGTIGSWTFDGFVSAIGTSAPMSDKIGFSASVKVTGKPVLA